MLVRVRRNERATYVVYGNGVMHGMAQKSRGDKDSPALGFAIACIKAKAKWTAKLGKQYNRAKLWDSQQHFFWLGEEEVARLMGVRMAYACKVVAGVMTGAELTKMGKALLVLWKQDEDERKKLWGDCWLWDTYGEVSRAHI